MRSPGHSRAFGPLETLALLAIPALLSAGAAGCVRGGDRAQIIEVRAYAPGEGEREVPEGSGPVALRGGELLLRFREVTRLPSGTLSVGGFYPSLVWSEDPSLLEVVSADLASAPAGPRHVVVRGLRVGEGALIVAGPGSRSYRVPVAVGEVAEVGLALPIEALGLRSEALSPERASEGAPPAFVAGAELRLLLTPRDPRGRRVRGRGAVPRGEVRVEGPASVLALSDTALTLRLEAEGEVRVRVGGSARRLEVVSPARVRRLRIVRSSFSFGGGCLAQPFDQTTALRAHRPGERFPPEPGLILVAAALEDGQPVVDLDGILEIASATPEVCELRPTEAPDAAYDVLRFYGEEARGFALTGYELHGLRPGRCLLRARLGDAEAEREVAFR